MRHERRWRLYFGHRGHYQHQPSHVLGCEVKGSGFSYTSTCSGRIGMMQRLPELRRRAEDHRGDSGAAGDREDPQLLGSASAGTPLGACGWPGAASGLTLPNRDRSGDAATGAAGVGCVRGFAGQRKPPDDEEG